MQVWEASQSKEQCTEHINNGKGQVEPIPVIRERRYFQLLEEHECHKLGVSFHKHHQQHALDLGVPEFIMDALPALGQVCSQAHQSEDSQGDDEGPDVHLGSVNGVDCGLSLLQ